MRNCLPRIRRGCTVTSTLWFPIARTRRRFLTSRCWYFWKKWDQFDNQRSFIAWARGIAYNEVRNFLRKFERRDQHLPDDVMEAIAEESTQLEGWLAARSSALTGCLEKLRPEERRLIELCYISGQTVRSVADQLGRPASAVYKQRQRLRKRLFNCVEETLAAEDEA